MESAHSNIFLSMLISHTDLELPARAGKQVIPHHHELAQTQGPRGTIKVQIGSTPAHLEEIVAVIIDFLYVPFHDGSAEKCC